MQQFLPQGGFVLAIRTDSETAELYILTREGKIANKQIWQAGRNLSKDLLKTISNLLKKAEINFNNLGAVVVYRGPGSFTGLRIGISVANAIAYSLDIPVVGTTGKRWITVDSKQINKTKNRQFIVPEYGAEPNITKPKK